MLMRSTRIAATILLLSWLLGAVAASALPPDIPPYLKDKIKTVVSRVVLGIKAGLYPFAKEPTELGPGNKAFLTLQQSTPPSALENLEKGFPIARFSAEQDILISGVTIPAGRYYLVMWIADLPFERFGVKFPPRVPLLIFVKEQGFEPVDFAIPCKVEVEVPNKNPEKTFSLTMAVAPDACKQGSSEAADLVSAAGRQQPLGPISISIWGIGTIVISRNPGDPIRNPGMPISIPPAGELFPKAPKEPTPPPPPEPPPPPK